MIFIFDLDSTLLNKKEFFNSFAPVLGLSLKDFIGSSEQGKKKGKDKYSLLEHINYLRHNGYISGSGKELENKIQKHIKNINNYLFEDTVPLLEYLKNTKNKLILATYGDKKWQKAKVDNLDIKKYFDRIIVTDKDKQEELKDLDNSNEEIYIINDKASETLALQKFFSNKARVFLIKSHRSYDVKHNLPVYSLKEARKIIEYEITKTRNK